MIGCVIFDWYGGQTFFGADYADVGSGGAGESTFTPAPEAVRFIRTTRKGRSF
jgi:hypothetical protein